MKRSLVLIIVLFVLCILTPTMADTMTVNFREAVSEKTLSNGKYRQIEGTNLQFFIPNDLFIEVQIPDKEGYENTFLILSYKDDPFCSVEIEAGETEQTFDEFYKSLVEKEKEGAVSGVTLAEVNGLQSVVYTRGNETVNGIYPYTYVYIVDGCYVKYTVNILNNASFNKHANWVVCSLELIK